MHPPGLRFSPFSGHSWPYRYGVLQAEPDSFAGHRSVVALFAATTFVGAAMLFLVQPLVARMLLPSYGGSATVWSTASLFFQVMLLVGYVYADRTTQLLGPRGQRRVHVLVLLAPLALLPLALPDSAVPPEDSSPVVWLLRTLAVMVALPFLVLATTGPLVQRWYSWSGRPRAQDPYFLFAASNLGSFFGLLSYPFLIEPFLTLDVQLKAWSAGFLVFVVLVLACLVLPVRSTTTDPVPAQRAEPAESISWRRQLRWCGWAVLPSGLMLSVTSYLSTDVAPIPLLWVLPLATYLATFVGAFARTSRETPLLGTRLAVALAVTGAVSSTATFLAPVMVAVPLQLLMLAAVGFAAHARLSADRPETSSLTRFYLVIAVGGALGGLLNGVVAPLVFDRVIEHGLMMTCVPLLLIGIGSLGGGDEARARRDAQGRRIALGLAAAGLCVAALVTTLDHGLGTTTPDIAILMALIAVLGWALSYFRAVALVFLVLLQAAVFAVGSSDVIARDRTFYGSYAVQDQHGRHTLLHGTTTHGSQFLDPAKKDVPTTYYARSGPLGDVFATDGPLRVGVVGLGAGTIAAYGRAGDSFTFYEIDPAVVRFAEDTRYFTFLADSQADIDVKVGDGRLGLTDAPQGSFDLLLLDAFSSDAIPTHLLTLEAFRTYADRLAPGGLMVVHISNRNFDLRPLLAGTAKAMGWHGLAGSKGGTEDGAFPSLWVALAEDDATLDRFRQSSGWDSLPTRTRTWTDDYSSVLPLLS